MPRHVISNVIGFDDFPFSRDLDYAVSIVGTVFAGLRFDGVVMGQIRRDGDDAADVIAKLILELKFSEHIRLVMLQGIAMGGFNVVNVPKLHGELQLPVLVVARKKPDYSGIRKALLEKVPDGEKKWHIIESLGPMEPVQGVYVQRAGISLSDAGEIIKKFAVHGNIPEPLRTAHLIAGAFGRGVSSGRV